MTALLGKQCRVASKALSSDKDTADQMISRIAVLVSMIARPAPHIERDQQLPAELEFALRAAGIYGTRAPRRHGDLHLACRVPCGRSRPWPWRVAGSWPLASGYHDAGWIGRTCVMMEGDPSLDAVDGPGPIPNRLIPFGRGRRPNR